LVLQDQLGQWELKGPEDLRVQVVLQDQLELWELKGVEDPQEL
jgi:hypothetical protein